MESSMLRALCYVFGIFLLVCRLQSAQIVDELCLYGTKAPDGVWHAPWNVLCEERQEAETGTACLWFNADHQAKPWAGVAFRIPPERALALDETWLQLGYIRFLVNVGRDAYGNPAAIRFQLRPEIPGLRYQALSATFIERGRGTDEDPGTWQEVFVPLTYWTELKPGSTVAGISIQCRNDVVPDYGLAEVSFVRFDQPPEWVRQRAEETVCQPWVEWPGTAELPVALLRTPMVAKNGAFVDADGRRLFVLNPYCGEDQRLDLWGTYDAAKADTLPTHGLFDPAKHGWIYRDLLDNAALRRLGFNSYSVTMPGKPFWDTVGYRPRRKGPELLPLPDIAARIGVPVYVDTVAWPWTLGAPGAHAEDTDLMPESFTDGRNHWTPYRIIGEGRQVWLGMWQVYAERYRDAGVPVFGFELMNEPAYFGMSEDHLAEFQSWLQRRYGQIQVLNACWQTNFADWSAAAAFEDDEKGSAIPGRFFDYDEYLSGCFSRLVADGVERVRSILPETLIGVQTMGGFVMNPREAVWKHRFVQHETLVITPTGGGRWTPGSANRSRPERMQDALMASAPLENDLLLALAGSRMIYDNETYLSGQTAQEVRNLLWRHVLAGLDGLSVFSWSKRGWAWWKSKDSVYTEADKYPYSNLNPVARRTAALHGICDFAAEVQPLAPLILPKPWGPSPRIGLIYSWAQARSKACFPRMRDKTGYYYAALKYGQWNMAVIPSDRLPAGEEHSDSALDILVVGSPGCVEAELVPKLTQFVSQGGVLLWGEETAPVDLYGRPVDVCSLLGVAAGSEQPGPTGIFAGEIKAATGIRDVSATAGTDVVLRDDTGRAIVFKRRLGNGCVYTQTADLAGYPLAMVLRWIVQDLARTRGNGSIPDAWMLASIREPETGNPAVNVLCSRRSYSDRHVLLLLNQDDYAREVQVSIPGIGEKWRVTDGLTQQNVDPGPDGSVRISLAPFSPAVLIYSE